MPDIIYLNEIREPIDENSSNIRYTKYIFRLRDDIFYQNHPAFLKENWSLDREIESIYDLNLSTRKLDARDYIYAIKRMALRENSSPILDIMNGYIIGLDEYSKMVSKLSKEREGFDLRDYNISGVELIDDFSFSITINGRYPQFLYWLSMNFFAPIPWEVERFYNQDILKRRNISINRYPLGTGAFYMAENNPNQKMVLMRNPNYHTEYYPNSRKSSHS